jgi:hypothetical protein
MISGPAPSFTMNPDATARSTSAASGALGYMVSGSRRGNPRPRSSRSGAASRSPWPAPTDRTGVALRGEPRGRRASVGLCLFHQLGGPLDREPGARSLFEHSSCSVSIGHGI